MKSFLLATSLAAVTFAARLSTQTTFNPQAEADFKNALPQALEMLKSHAPIPIEDINEETFTDLAAKITVELAWDWLDADNSGAISGKEAVKAFKQLGFNKKEIEEVHKEIDTNNDRGVDKDEAAAAVQELMLEALTDAEEHGEDPLENIKARVEALENNGQTHVTVENIEGAKHDLEEIMEGFFHWLVEESQE